MNDDEVETGRYAYFVEKAQLYASFEIGWEQCRSRSHHLHHHFQSAVIVVNMVIIGERGMRLTMVRRLTGRS